MKVAKEAVTVVSDGVDLKRLRRQRTQHSIEYSTMLVLYGMTIRPR